PTATGRGYRVLHRRRLRLPDSGHALPLGTHRVQGPTRAIRGPSIAAASRQGRRRGTRLPRHGNRRACFVTGQTGTRLHEPWFPRPTQTILLIVRGPVGANRAEAEQRESAALGSRTWSVDG